MIAGQGITLNPNMIDSSKCNTPLNNTIAAPLRTEVSIPAEF